MNAQMRVVFEHFENQNRYARRYEPTNTVLDHTAGPAPQEFAVHQIPRSSREHHFNQTTLEGILQHMGDGIDEFIAGGGAEEDDNDLDDYGDSFEAEDSQQNSVERQERRKKRRNKRRKQRSAQRGNRVVPCGQHQTTAVVGSGLYEPPRVLTEQEVEFREAAREEMARTNAGFEAARARNGGGRYSPGVRRRSHGPYKVHDMHRYAGAGPSFAKSYREFRALDRERKKQEAEKERQEREAHEAQCQLDLERLTSVDGRLFLFYRKHAPHMISKVALCCCCCLCISFRGMHERMLAFTGFLTLLFGRFQACLKSGKGKKTPSFIGFAKSTKPHWTSQNTG